MNGYQIPDMTTAAASPARPPRGRLGPRAGFTAVTYAFWATMVGTTLPTPLYVHYVQRFGFSELTITVIFATYAAGVIAALLLFGRVSDATGRRPVLLLGLALSALSAVVFLLAQGLAPLLVGRFLSGLSAGIFTGTATATLVDLAGPERRGRATLVAAVVNIGGLGCGPLIAGILAQLAPLPLRLSYWVSLGLLAPASVGVALMADPVRPKAGVKFRLQALSVPSETRAAFIPAALAGFAGFAVTGLSTAVSPAFLGQILTIRNDIVVGAVVFGVFAASILGQLLLDLMSPRTAMAGGSAALIVGMALLAVSLASSSLALLVIGVMVAGGGQGLSFRAALSAVNGASPPARRAEVASSFFVVAYLAISIPVIGEGVLAQAVGLRTAGIVFAAVVAVMASLVVAMLASRATARAAEG